MTDIICISPIDGRELVRRPSAADAVIAATLEKARRAQREWARVSVRDRATRLLAFLDAMLAMNQEIVPELARQMGRPVRFGGELGPFEDRVRYVAAMAEDALAPVIPPDVREGIVRRVQREPLGVVFVVAPWNYPYITSINTIGPALLAGNAVVLKHAAQTLLVGERFQAAMDRAGLPDGLFANLALTHEQTARILASGLVDHVNFTGSVEGGRAIERAAAGSFTSVGLELGGKDPAYVRPDAALDFAVQNLVDGAFYNSGQCCCGIERIYVHEAVHDRFLDRFVERTRGYTLGDPLDEATTLGPMAQGRFAALVRAQTADAIAKGARAHLDPADFAANKEGTPYLAPQVLTGVDHTMAVMREESFGPVVGIMKVSGDEEALALMNDSHYGLTASIWTADLDAAERIGGAIETGTVFLNRCDYLDPGLAWTGVKDTGRGAALSRIGFETLTRPKSFHMRHQLPG